MEQNMTSRKITTISSYMLGFALLFTATVGTGSQSVSRTLTLDATETGPCTPPTNAIACENSRPGNPQSDWDINGDGDPTIQGA